GSMKAGDQDNDERRRNDQPPRHGCTLRNDGDGRPCREHWRCAQGGKRLAALTPRRSGKLLDRSRSRNRPTALGPTSANGRSWVSRGGGLSWSTVWSVVHRDREREHGFGGGSDGSSCRIVGYCGPTCTRFLVAVCG